MAGRNRSATIRAGSVTAPPLLASTQSFAVVVALLPALVIIGFSPTNLFEPNTNRIFVTRTNLTNALAVSFTVLATDANGYQWSVQGALIVGATNATFLLPDGRRTNSGAYSVTVSGPGGAAARNVQLHVATPQQVRAIQRLADGSIRLFFNDEDGTAAIDFSRLRVLAISLLLTHEANIN